MGYDPDAMQHDVDGFSAGRNRGRMLYENDEMCVLFK
jgi:hypothetical protein